MSIATSLLKANHIGVREYKGHLSKKLLNEVLVITERGTPISVNLPYLDLMELIDIIDEISDERTVETVKEARKAITAKAKGIPVSKLFKKIRTA